MSTPIQTTESYIQKPSSIDHFNIVMKEGTNGDEILSDNDKVACMNMETDKVEDFDASFHLDKEKPMRTGDLSDPPKSSLADIIEQRGIKRLNGEPDTDKRKCPAVIINSDDEAYAAEDKLDYNIVEDHSKIKGLFNSDADALPSEGLDEKFYCTICDKVALEVHPHPLLKVIICGDCNCIMKEKTHPKV